jgi:UDP-N-acetylmuramoyl-tripeptide--D-alanyl-D-alanine ligase
LATPGNLNNLIGVPMTIFMIHERHNAAVIECGTNQRGEIARLAKIVRPDAALVLNVDIEHTEGLGSLAGVADEEAALFVTATRAVVSTEEELLLARIPVGKPRLTFAASAAADVRVARRAVTGAGRQQIVLELRPSLVDHPTDARVEVTLSLLGATAALNTAAALAAVSAAIARPLRRADLIAIATALEAMRPVAGRMQLRDCGGIVVIDDTYNSNPRSLRAALTAARETADGLHTRLIVALGDMLELGDLSAEMHRDALDDILAARPDATILVGPEFAAARSSAKSDLANALLFSDSRDAASVVSAQARPRDVLLVKGSRGIAMERVIEGLPSTPSRG